MAWRSWSLCFLRSDDGGRSSVLSWGIRECMRKKNWQQIDFLGEFLKKKKKKKPLGFSRPKFEKISLKIFFQKLKHNNFMPIGHRSLSCLCLVGRRVAPSPHITRLILIFLFPPLIICIFVHALEINIDYPLPFYCCLYFYIWTSFVDHSSPLLWLFMLSH